MTREEVARIVGAARELVEAHGRRNPNSERATLAEETAIYALSDSVTKVLNRYRASRAA